MFQVLAIVFLAIGVVSGGSGPYLPSGWKPSGPAFLLPSEVQVRFTCIIITGAVREEGGHDSIPSNATGLDALTCLPKHGVVFFELKKSQHSGLEPILIKTSLKSLKRTNRITNHF